MQLMLNNLPADVAKQDLLALFAELGIPTPANISIAAGLGTHPAALVDFALDDHADLEAITRVLDGRGWKGHTLRATHVPLFH
jgi:hypothetical protein